MEMTLLLHLSMEHSCRVATVWTTEPKWRKSRKKKPKTQNFRYCFAAMGSWCWISLRVIFCGGHIFFSSCISSCKSCSVVLLLMSSGSARWAFISLSAHYWPSTPSLYIFLFALWLLRICRDLICFGVHVRKKIYLKRPRGPHSEFSPKIKTQTAWKYKLNH